MLFPIILKTSKIKHSKCNYKWRFWCRKANWRIVKKYSPWSLSAILDVFRFWYQFLIIGAFGWLSNSLIFICVFSSNWLHVLISKIWWLNWRIPSKFMSSYKQKWVDIIVRYWYIYNKTFDWFYRQSNLVSAFRNALSSISFL